ncbi:hypothetical protein [Nitrosophilus labii]|uniref:hypothetical protein n=1 Tax=Nitrosophilus labii TaxID=2706014 RepID=UPI001656BD6E|nr:hypothetical protein [Nitrosophilus labii]
MKRVPLGKYAKFLRKSRFEIIKLTLQNKIAFEEVVENGKKITYILVDDETYESIYSKSAKNDNNIKLYCKKSEEFLKSLKESDFEKIKILVLDDEKVLFLKDFVKDIVDIEAVFEGDEQIVIVFKGLKDKKVLLLRFEEEKIKSIAAPKRCG